MTMTKQLRLSAVTAFLAVLVLALPIAPASASPGAFAIAGQAHLSGALGGSGTGCFGGTGAGAHDSDLGVVTAGASFSYDNTAVVTGTASGTLRVGSQSVNFNWLRVGATAVLTLSGNGHTGAGVAAFAPSATVGAVGCQSPGSHPGTHGDHAVVAGVGVIL